MSEEIKNITNSLNLVREKKPLVQNITNFVVMNTTANTLLSIGASPVMSHAREELNDMISIVNSLVINIGTLDEYWINSMKEAIKIASNLNKPIVLDPVGAGATKLRTETSLELIKLGKISVIRGNFGEINALLGIHGKTKGVDTAMFSSEEAKDLAVKAAREFNAIVAVTGPVDYVSDGNILFKIENGVSLLEKVTGTGCMVTSLIGAFCAVEKPLYATLAALLTFNIVAEKAYEETQCPGSFHIKIYDWLYKIDQETIISKAKMSKVKI